MLASSKIPNRPKFNNVSSELGVGHLGHLVFVVEREDGLILVGSEEILHVVHCHSPYML